MLFVSVCDALPSALALVVGMVKLDALADLRAPLVAAPLEPFKPLTHVTQPDAALLVIVTVRPAVDTTEPVLSAVAKVSVLPLKTKLKVGVTVAVTTIWSLVITLNATFTISPVNVTLG